MLLLLLLWPLPLVLPLPAALLRFLLPLLNSPPLPELLLLCPPLAPLLGLRRLLDQVMERWRKGAWGRPQVLLPRDWRARQ